MIVVCWIVFSVVLFSRLCWVMSCLVVLVSMMFGLLVVNCVIVGVVGGSVWIIVDCIDS